MTACTPFKDDLAVADVGVQTTPNRTDGPSPSAPTARTLGLPCDSTKLFGARTFVGGLSALAAPWIAGLRLSPDYRTAYFHAKGLGGHTVDFDLYTATRADLSGPFEGSAPIPGDGINTTDDELDATVSGDGLTLVFDRSSHGQLVRTHYATRTSISMPFTYAGPIFSAQHEGPFLREDGQVLYLGFRSNRDGGGDIDIYRAMRRGSGFEAPSAVAELNSSFVDKSPVVTPDDLTIYFHSTRPRGGPPGPGQIWVATRATTSERFSEPTNVVELNSPEELLPTFVTRDGCTLYFFSVSPAEPHGNNLYEAHKPAP